MKRPPIAHTVSLVLGIVLMLGVHAAIADQAPDLQPSPQAVALLDKMDAAYAKLQSAQFDGHIIGRFNVDGETRSDDVAFTSSFRAPNHFCHDCKGDVVVVSNGQKVLIYQFRRNAYLSIDAPPDQKSRSAQSDWPKTMAVILRDQNPSLLLALVQSASIELKNQTSEIARMPDSTVDGVAYPTLQFEVPDNHQVVTMLLDPATSLLRQVKFDMRKSLALRGALNVLAADVTVDYTATSINAPIDDAKFAWSPPQGAVVVSANTTAMLMDDSGPTDLVGKPAPDFTLQSLDDKPVKLSSMKGSVIVLDLWATWCGPCVHALPNIDQLYKDQSPNGLKVFAINLQEDKNTVKDFVEKKKLALPVLLDTTGDVARAYGANAIPETVIIGKDGTVKKVFVGTSDEIEAQIRQIVQKEMGN